MGAREKMEEVKASGSDRRKHFLFASLFSVRKLCKTVQLAAQNVILILFLFVS